MAKKILTLLLFSLVLLSVEARADAINRWVSGEVIATDTVDTPNTIVIKGKTWKGQALIVGADVIDKTVIKRGGKTISLKDVKPGETVEMEYAKGSTLTATSISVKE